MPGGVEKLKNQATNKSAAQVERTKYIKLAQVLKTHKSAWVSYFIKSSAANTPGERRIHGSPGSHSRKYSRIVPFKVLKTEMGNIISVLFPTNKKGRKKRARE